MRLLPASLTFALVAATACGPTTTTPPVADAANDAPADQCRSGDLAPLPPGCRVVNPDPCTGRGTVVCDDAGADAAADAPADAAGDVPIVCSGSGAASFPTFSSACSADGDCAVAVHQTDCCGNQRGLGIVASQRAAFDAAEAVCRPMYPGCGCPTRGILCDDERWAFTADAVGVACRAGRCTTFVR